ncbi:MAG: hypothetical protein M3Z92_05095 [Bacteroidota bacterium]|nr:hypothetical protein [Bacteroidota bacterium]
MNAENTVIDNKDDILENLTRTLLYEGYSLFPYHRNAIKNQKPIPFGVVYPADYNAFNMHAHSEMHTDCIVTGDGDLMINVTVRFLHLKKTEVFQINAGADSDENNFSPIYEISVNGELYQAGWQTIERKINSGDLRIGQLVDNPKTLSISFDKVFKSKFIWDLNGEITGKQIISILPIEGTVTIKAIPVENMENAYRVIVFITNSTPVENANEISRDEISRQSFLSTNTILNTTTGEFISLQNPGEKWVSIIEQCQNKGTWPILIDENNKTLLSSPIIVYDYPKINPRSNGDLFDSLEIEEALILHFSVMSDEEKNKIAQSDEKLRSMLNKVGQVTPNEIINLHGGFSSIEQPTIHTEKEK